MGVKNVTSRRPKQTKRAVDPDTDVLEQGSTYNPTDGDEDVEDILESSEKSSPPKQLVVFGGIAIAIVIVIVVGYLIFSGFSKSGDDATGENISAEGEALGDDELLLDEELFVFKYTEEELEELRAYGYTADEIEAEELAETDPTILISKAKALQRNTLRENYIELQEELLDQNSEAYTKLIGDTWLNGNPTTVHSDTPDEITTEQYKENVDYKKLPAHGEQLMVKVWIRSRGVSAFMTVHPERYERLYDTGNILVSYQVVHYGDGDYLYNIKEVTM